MFNKILVANRGEIAVRVMRTAREMGIATVAVYSEADEKALHVLTADEAVCLGPSEPGASYLNVDKILDAAKQTGAQAIHPGYGFLAENPAFAKRVAEAGLKFIGPGAEVMEKLGDKTTARCLMADSGVPIIPGMLKPESDPKVLLEKAEEIGYPVLIKAAAGGGGIGMRVVNDAAELAGEAKKAASEAAGAFGNGAIYLEKYLDRPRHVEVQILADGHGNAVHVFERECSIQRRHQKIIEETPSPAVDDKLREKMGQAAVDAAKAAGYENAGTVEFLLDRTGKFYFLEVNTRLQVEHPITEMITGLDLVRCQIEIAAGQKLPFEQKDLQRKGHAIECRIYAEDPEADFMPSPGRILFMKHPQGPGVRYDCGVYSGFEVPVFYDPILGKLIVWAQDRAGAINRMIRALSECVVLGVKIPIEFMMEILQSEAFRSGATHTGFIPEHFPKWKPAKDENDNLMQVAFVADQLLGPRGVANTGKQTKDAFPSPWQTLGQWDIT